MAFQVPQLDLSRYQFPLQAFIGGKFVDSTGNDKRTLVSSVNDDIVTKELQWSNAQDVNLAVDAAEEGLRQWKTMSREQRRDVLVKFGALIRENGQQLHWLEAVLVGKDAGFSNFEIGVAADLFIYYGNMIDKFGAEVLRAEDDTMRYTLRQPWGVCAGICPFNAPLITLAMKAAPALACGNTIIIKTSETNPFSTLFMASLSCQAGLPPGVLNCLVGGAEVGDALASHMRIRKVSFTGSVAIGKLVHVAAAKSNLKSVTTELGGKSPVIVFPDADLDGALRSATMFLMMNGQGCALGTRLYLHESIADAFVDKLVNVVRAHARGLGGDPTTQTTLSSPLYHHRQKATVMSFLKDGQNEATLLCGGRALGEKGCYVEPALFIDPSPHARVLKEEIFGPVLVVSRFSSEDEVLEMANDTEFGLAAYIWTKDLGRALRFAQQLEAGSISVNGAGGFSPEVPMGGWKQSGQGLENGRDAMLDWTQSKSVAIAG